MEGAKNVSAKAASTACKAAISLGAGDALMLTGFALFGLAVWLRSQAFRLRDEIPKSERLRILDAVGSESGSKGKISCVS